MQRMPTEEFVARLRSRMPADVAQTFTWTQLKAIELAFGTRFYNRHLMALRPVIPLPWGRYYFALYVGRDRRRRMPRNVGVGLAMGLAVSFAVFGMIGAAAMACGWHLV